MEYAELSPGLPHGVIHGDAWQGNVVMPDDGRPVLLDLEHIAVGPPEWDLIQIAADRGDFARISGRDYAVFVDQYGHDVSQWSGFRTLADLVELRWCVFVASKSAEKLAAAAELRHRIACLRGEVPRPWTWDRVLTTEQLALVAVVSDSGQLRWERGDAGWSMGRYRSRGRWGNR